MIGRNNFEKWILGFMGFLLCLSLILIPLVINGTTGIKDAGIKMEYESKLFSTGNLVTIDIQIEDSNWNDLLKTALQKKYYSCIVNINGTKFQNVGIRTKGGSSLDDVVNSKTSDRFSFLLKFNKYKKGQTCFGLDQLALNNIIGDATYMKDAITYDMASYIGLEHPLYNYAKITINGTYHGCYLILENIQKSFLKRNYGEKYGHLYKPEGKGADLYYTDDRLSSYPGILEEAITKSKNSDKKRLIASIKNVNKNKCINSSVEIDNVLKYMALQTIATNFDGFTGYSVHNYFLYEKNSKISLIPWDYNLAYGGYMEDEFDNSNMDFGTMSKEELNALEIQTKTEKSPFHIDNDAEISKCINLPIDTPFLCDLKYRTFFMKLLEHKQYKNMYHQYLNVLCRKYILGGKLQSTMNKIADEISPIVGTEANAFFSQKQFKKAFPLFYSLLEKKSQSVLGQLNGTIPSTWEGQKKDSSALISGGGIQLSNLGDFI